MNRFRNYRPGPCVLQRQVYKMEFRMGMSSLMTSSKGSKREEIWADREVCERELAGRGRAVAKQRRVDS